MGTAAISTGDESEVLKESGLTVPRTVIETVVLATFFVTVAVLFVYGLFG